MKSNDYLLDVLLKTWPFISAGIIGILYYIKAALNIIISVAGDLILLWFLLLFYRSLNIKIERNITPALGTGRVHSIESVNSSISAGGSGTTTSRTSANHIVV